MINGELLKSIRPRGIIGRRRFTLRVNDRGCWELFNESFEDNEVQISQFINLLSSLDLAYPYNFSH